MSIAVSQSPQQRLQMSCFVRPTAKPQINPVYNDLQQRKAVNPWRWGS